MSDHDIAVTINGVAYRRRAPARRTLLDFLRQDCGLTGTHAGCEHGVCGACTVLIDGRTARSCLTFAVQADGCEVTTVEALAGADGSLNVLLRALPVNGTLQIRDPKENEPAE